MTIRMGGAIEDFGLRIRRAVASDADAVATVYLRARHHGVPGIPALPDSDDSVRSWLAGVVVDGDEVWVAETEDHVVVAMMVLEGGWIDQLYVDPSSTRRGIGTRLMDVAKRSRPEGLQLWTFQSNDGAHRFYQRHRFKAEERTNGSRNRERTPDVRYVWDRRATSVEEIGVRIPPNADGATPASRSTTVTPMLLST